MLLNRRTLMYLASDPDGSGPWLYSMDIEHRIPHRLTFGPDRYTSLAADGDGKRLVVTRASPKRTLWQLRVHDSASEFAPGSNRSDARYRVLSPTGAGLLDLCLFGGRASESIWKRANGTDTELWSGHGAQIIGSPAISPDGGQIAFSVRQRSQTLLYVMQADGTNARWWPIRSSCKALRPGRRMAGRSLRP